ncbi:MAG: sulfotransferase [Balneolaceae bacterium]|nr:sulfotransferase [Balneolaceae bacterium]
MRAVLHLNDPKRAVRTLRRKRASITASTNRCPGVKVVEKSVEHAEFAPLLHKMFPLARFVHIVRNPYGNIVSLRKAKTIQSKFPLVFRMLDSLYNNYYHLYRNRQLIDDYYIIRYEDLLSNPEQHIEKLTQFLELPMHEALLQPTKLGKSVERQQLHGAGFLRVRCKPNRQLEGVHHPMEALFINRHLSYPFEAFGYTKLPDPSIKDFLKPAKNEGIKRYLINRLYLAYLSYNPGKEL